MPQLLGKTAKRKSLAPWHPVPFLRSACGAWHHPLFKLLLCSQFQNAEDVITHKNPSTAEGIPGATDAVRGFAALSSLYQPESRTSWKNSVLINLYPGRCMTGRELLSSLGGNKRPLQQTSTEGSGSSLLASEGSISRPKSHSFPLNLLLFSPIKMLHKSQMITAPLNHIFLYVPTYT